MFFGGRRGGKTVGNIGKILYIDLFHKPHLKSAIIIACDTKEDAMDLYWDKLEKANKKQRLGYNFKKAKGRIETPRNTIIFIGLSNYKAATKKLGMAVKLVLIDESQKIKNKILKEFIDDVSVWSGFDHDGIVCLSGNPPAIHIGEVSRMWFKAEELGIFSLATSIFKNPKFSKEKIEKRFAAERKRRGLKEGEEDAAFKRMARGEWVEDTESIVFKPQKRNFFKHLPAGKYERVIGLDFGKRHHDAIAVLAFNKDTKKTYLEYEWQKAGIDIDEILNKVGQVAKRYNVTKVYYDPGALGSKIGLQAKKMYGSSINFVEAKTKEKMQSIELVRAEIKIGQFMLQENGIFHEECQQIIFNEDHTEIDDVKGLHSDIMPAIVYAFKEIKIGNFIEENSASVKKDKKMNVKEYMRELAKREKDPYYDGILNNQTISNEDIAY